MGIYSYIKGSLIDKSDETVVVDICDCSSVLNALVMKVLLIHFRTLLSAHPG